ncbi:hypothetical protein EV175_002365 [Coemansia sp. RSA 1933]|nr:hypothetical protein EV175_002365 [Coemansia sp. RSA 1933]
MTGEYCSKNPFSKDNESSLPFPRVCGTSLINPPTAWSSQSSVQTDTLAQHQHQQQPVQVNYTHASENIPDDQPPAYSLDDPNAQQQQQHQHAQQYPLSSNAVAGAMDMKTEATRSNELSVSRRYPFDRALRIHVDQRISASMVAKRDTDIHNTNTVYVQAEVTYSGSSIKDMIHVSDVVNGRNEYNLRIESLGSFWTNMWLRCKITVVFPAWDQLVHPGLSVELSHGSVELTYLDNVHFTALDLQLAKTKVTLDKVAGGAITVWSTSGSVTAKNVAAISMFHAQTTSDSVTLSNVSTRAGSLDATTTNSQINCNGLFSKDVSLRTTNSSIGAIDVVAESLVMNTTNSKITGSWNVARNLNATTTNSKIHGVITFMSPESPVKVVLATSNSSIIASLPADEFRGIFDCTTSNSNVNLLWKGRVVGSDASCPVSLSVDEKSSRRGVVGSTKAKELHSFSATTTNSSVDISFE